MTWISLFALFQFTPSSSFLSSFSHFTFPFLQFPLSSSNKVSIDLCKRWSEGASDVPFKTSLVLSLLFHSSCSFICLSLLHLWFTLIHFLLFLSPSLTSISLTHSRAWTCERTLILHVYILLWNELIVPFVSHFTKSLRIVHELHKFKLFVYFVVEFSVRCVVSSLVDATFPKPYQHWASKCLQ